MAQATVPLCRRTPLPGLTAVLDQPILRLTPACWCWPPTPGRAGDNSGPGSVDQSDLRLRPCLDVGRPGADLAATRPVLARHQAVADDPPGLIPLPAGIGVWPAAVCLFGFGWLELVQLGPNHAGTSALGDRLVGDLGGRARSCSARAGSAQQIRSKSIASTLAQMSIFLGLRAGS